MNSDQVERRRGRRDRASGRARRTRPARGPRRAGRPPRTPGSEAPRSPARSSAGRADRRRSPARRRRSAPRRGAARARAGRARRARARPRRPPAASGTARATRRRRATTTPTAARRRRGSPPAAARSRCCARSAGQTASVAATSDVTANAPAGQPSESRRAVEQRQQARVEQRQAGDEQHGLVGGRLAVLVGRLRAEPEQQRAGDEQQRHVHDASAAGRASRRTVSATPTASATPPAAISGPRCGGGRRSSRRPPARLIVTQRIASLAVSDLVITEDREAVRHVVLNRPEKRNALNQDLVRAIGAALRDGRRRPVRARASSCAATARCSPPAWTSPRSPALAGAPERAAAVPPRSAWRPGTSPRR